MARFVQWVRGKDYDKQGTPLLTCESKVPESAARRYNHLASTLAVSMNRILQEVLIKVVKSCLCLWHIRRTICRSRRSLCCVLETLFFKVKRFLRRSFSRQFKQDSKLQRSNQMPKQSQGPRTLLYCTTSIDLCMGN
jgi:hypothetical protein